MVLSDEQLIELYLAGDSEAFNGLVKKWERRIFNFALRYCGSREEAQDLCQEIFTITFQRLSGLRDHRRFAPWLYKIALNSCRMRSRVVKRKQLVSLDSDDFKRARELGSNSALEQRVSTPEEALGEIERGRILKEAMGEIPDEQRLVILMKEYEGLRFHEIAEILDCPLSTVKSRLYSGLRSLRDILQQRGLGV